MSIDPVNDNQEKNQSTQYSSTQEEVVKKLVDRLEEERNSLEYAKDKKRHNSLFISGIITVVSLYCIYMYYFIDKSTSILYYLAPLLTFLIFVIAALALFFTISDFMEKSNMIKNLKDQIKDTNNEIDLEKIKIQSIEIRAEKLFKLHQYELDKYYKQNLEQGKQVFKAGILFLLIGFAIIGVSILLIGLGKVSNASVVAILGAIASILSDFIAVVYLKMFSEINKSSTQFHDRLVTTHNLMFSNFIASKIKNEEMREKTLRDVALSVNLGKIKQNDENN